MSKGITGKMSLLMSQHVGTSGSVHLDGDTKLTYALTDEEAQQVGDVIAKSRLRVIKEIISQAVDN